MIVKIEYEYFIYNNSHTYSYFVNFIQTSLNDINFYGPLNLIYTCKKDVKRPSTTLSTLVIITNTIGGTAQAIILHARLGVSRENDHAPKKGLNFFRNFR